MKIDQAQSTFRGPFLLYKVKKIAKNSEKILKNAQKYSKNNGEDPNLIRSTVPKLKPKNYKKMRPFLKMDSFCLFFGSNFGTIDQIKLGSSPLFLEYFCVFL